MDDAEKIERAMRGEYIGSIVTLAPLLVAQIEQLKAERDALIKASLTQYSNGRWGAFLGNYALGAFDSRDAAIRELFGCAGLDAEPAERGIDGDA